MVVLRGWRRIFARDYDLYLSYGMVCGRSQNKRVLRSPSGNFIIIPENGLPALYSPGRENDALLKGLNEYYVENPGNLSRLLKEYFEKGAHYSKKNRALSTGVRGLGNRELAERHLEATRLVCEHFPYLWTTFLLNDLFMEKVTQVVEGLAVSSVDKGALLAYATEPTKLASILLLNEEAKKKSLKQLAKEFAWITTLDLRGDAATPADIRNRLGHGGKKAVKKPSVFSKLGSRERKYIELNREMTFMKDKRDDYRRQASYEIIPLFEEISRRIGVDRHDCAFLSPVDIQEALAGKKKPAELRKLAKLRRQSGFCIIMRDGVMRVEDDGKKIGALRKELEPAGKGEGVKASEVRGLVGCGGKLRGRIRLVITLRDLDKVARGDVLCAITTNPNHMPAMQKAAAFVTDEGGITCHAAIVAREMRKPCVIGTKVATQVFKDGDFVEVDADKGTVRKIR